MTSYIKMKKKRRKEEKEKGRKKERERKRGRGMGDEVRERFCVCKRDIERYIVHKIKRDRDIHCS